MILTHNDVTYDTSTFPQASIDALIARGFTHVMSNEVAAKCVADIRAIVGKDAATADIKAWKAAHDDEYAKMITAREAEALAAIRDGTLGQRRTAEPRDPVAQEAMRIARNVVTRAMKAQGLTAEKEAIEAAVRAHAATPEVRDEAERAIAGRAKAAKGIDLAKFGLVKAAA